MSSLAQEGSDKVDKPDGIDQLDPTQSGERLLIMDMNAIDGTIRQFAPEAEPGVEGAANCKAA